MKKIYFFFFFLFLGCSCVFAKEVPHLVSVPPKCVEVKENVAILPIQVLSTKEGSLSKLIDVYQLGKVEHAESYELSISQLESSFVDYVAIDTLRDSESRSFISYSIEDDIDLKKGSTFMRFLLNVEFLEEVPSEIFVLGHEVVLGDSSLCRLVNGNNSEIVRTEVFVKEKDTYTLFYVVIILFLIVVVLVEFLIIMKKRKK